MKIYPGIIVRQRLTVQKQMGLLRERYAGLKKDFCCTVAIRSGWKMRGGFRGVLLLSAKQTRSLVCWENILWTVIRRTIQWTNSSVWFDGRVSPYFCQRPVSTASVRQESLPRNIPRRSWIRWTHLKSMLRLNAKEVLTHQNGEKMLPITDGRV